MHPGLWRREETELTDQAIQAWGWEPFLGAEIKRSGELFLDVGAHTGHWTRLLAPFYRKVIAVEPNPECLPLLRQGLPANVEVKELALWSSEGTLTLHLYPDPDKQHTSYLHWRHWSPTGVIEAPCLPMDSLGLEKLDFLKIDVEGAELFVLEGGLLTLTRVRPQVVVESHSRGLEAGLVTMFGEFHYDVTIRRNPHYTCEAPSAYSWVSAKPAEHLYLVRKVYGEPPGKEYHVLPEIAQPPHHEESYEDPRQQARVQWLVESSVGSVLELGCAEGYTLSKINRPGCCGVDYDQERIKEGKRKYPGITFYVMDIRYGVPFPDGSYDTVLCPELLEHMDFQDARNVLREALRVSRRKVLVTLPYDRDLVETPDHRWVPEGSSIQQLLEGYQAAVKVDGGFAFIQMRKEVP